MKCTLSNFGLIWSVLRIPSRVLQNIAKNNGGNDSTVVTSSNISVTRDINILAVGVQQLKHISLTKTTLHFGAIKVDIGIGLKNGAQTASLRRRWIVVVGERTRVSFCPSVARNECCVQFIRGRSA